MAEESERPGTKRSNVGCAAIDEPCTKKIVPRAFVPGAGLRFQRKSFTSPFAVQCSVPPVQLVVVPSAIAFLRCRGCFRECKVRIRLRLSPFVKQPFRHGVVTGADSVTAIVQEAMSRTA